MFSHCQNQFGKWVFSGQYSLKQWLLHFPPHRAVDAEAAFRAAHEASVILGKRWFKVWPKKGRTMGVVMFVGKGLVIQDDFGMGFDILF